MAEGFQAKYSGMTTNERLFSAGLLERFDDAARWRDRGKMIAFLVQVEFSESDATSIVDAVLAKPTIYGY